MMYQARKAITTPAPTKRTDVEMATFVILELWGEILMHLRLGVVQWATFVFLLITHSIRVDVPAFRLKPELQTYLSLEFTL